MRLEDAVCFNKLVGASCFSHPYLPLGPDVSQIAQIARFPLIIESNVWGDDMIKLDSSDVVFFTSFHRYNINILPAKYARNLEQHHHKCGFK